MAEQAQCFLDDTVRDRPRDREMVKMRVVNTRVAHIAVEGGNLVMLGESEFWVYEDHVPKIMALVEKNIAGIEAAKNATDVSIAADVHKAVDFAGSIAEVQALIANGKNERINEVYKHIMATTPKNWQAKFREMFGRSVEPFDSAEKLDTKPKLEPQIEREIRRARIVNSALNKKA